MPVGSQFTIKGDKDLVAKLNALKSPKQMRAIGRKALDAGGGVIKQATAANALKVKDTGLLAKSIKVRHAKPKYANSVMAVVGPTHMKRMMRRTKKGALRTVSKAKAAEWIAKGATLIPYDPANYGHIVERGAKSHRIGPKNKKAISIAGGHPIRGQVDHPGLEGIGFMRKAVDSRGRMAVDKVNRKLWEEIRKAARSRYRFGL